MKQAFEKDRRETLKEERLQRQKKREDLAEYTLFMLLAFMVTICLFGLFIQIIK